MSLRQVQNPWKTDVFTTVDATPTVSAPTSFVVPAGAAVYVEMTAVARSAAGLVSTTKVGAAVQNVGGVLTMTQVTLPLVAATGGLVIGVVNFTSTGVTIQPRVIGIVATSIEWLLDVRYWVN